MKEAILMLQLEAAFLLDCLHFRTGDERMAGTDNDLLAMALVGYEAQKAKINEAIRDIQAQLGPSGSRASKHYDRWRSSSKTHYERCRTQAHCRCTTEEMGGGEEEPVAAQGRGCPEETQAQRCWS